MKTKIKKHKYKEQLYEGAETHFWMKVPSSNQCDYNIWKRFYIEVYKPNIVEIVYTGVNRGRLIEVSYGSLLDMGQDYKYFGIMVKRILMKAAYTGSNPRKEIRELIEFNLQYAPEEFVEAISYKIT